MKRYGTFQAESNLPSKELRNGILDAITGREYETVDLKTAEQLLELIQTSDCKFNCRAKRMEDFVGGWHAAQLFDEAEAKYGELADDRYGLDVSFEEYINGQG